MRLALLLVAVPVLVTAGCEPPPPPPPYRIVVKVESDPGQPVAGAVVSRNKPLATTGPDGRAVLEMRGSDGEIIDVSVRCPESFQSPTKPTSIRLTRLADDAKTPEYQVSCPPSMRRVVVAVKADNGPNLPVLYLNRAVARTDASGAAHFALDVAPGAQFQVTLDTTEKGGERLKPQNPSRPFTVGQHDDILMYEQRFDVERPRFRVVKKHVPRAITH